MNKYYFTIGQMYRVIWVVAFRGIKQSKHVGMNKQTRDNHPILFQCWARLWVNIETALGECQSMWHKVYNRPSVGLVLGQRHGRLTGIEPAKGCDAGPTLKRYWVGRPTSCVRGTL